MRRAILACVMGLSLVPMAAGAQVSGARQGSRVSGADVNRSVSGAGTNPRVSGAPYPMPHAPPTPVPPLAVPARPLSPSPYQSPPTPQGRAGFHLGYGDTVPSDALDRRYRIGDYGHYGLVAPPAGMAWVRIGNDAVLVDLKTGTVASAQYDLFRQARGSVTPRPRP